MCDEYFDSINGVQKKKTVPKFTALLQLMIIIIIYIIIIYNIT